MTNASTLDANLTAEDLSVDLGVRQVLHDISLSIRPGEFVAVVGPNGAGKSTALRALAGLVPPRRGRVLLNGEPLAIVDQRRRARAIAYLPQDRTVHWPLAGERVVALGRVPHRAFAAAESDADRAAIQSAMARMDALQFAQRPIVTLSGGERARVLVARALAQEARFVIADEPTAGLDPAHTLHLFAEFARLAKEGSAIVTALHDLSLALRYATRVLLFAEGRLVADGPAASVITTDCLAQVFGIRTIVTTIDGIPIVMPVAPQT